MEEEEGEETSEAAQGHRPEPMWVPGRSRTVPASLFAPSAPDGFLSSPVAAVGDDLHEEEDYEDVDGEKMGAARPVCPEAFSEYEEEEEEEEADYINVTSEQNVQFVDIYGDSGSDYEKPTNEDKEEFIDIYGEEDCIYQNTGLV